MLSFNDLFQHTFCKTCVQERANEVCPIDRKPSKYIVDNIALSEQIGELIIRCKYGCKRGSNGGYVIDEDGCPATIKIADRYNHEKDCDFSTMQCPNNSACEPFLKKVRHSIIVSGRYSFNSGGYFTISNLRRARCTCQGPHPCNIVKGYLY